MRTRLIVAASMIVVLALAVVAARLLLPNRATTQTPPPAPSAAPALAQTVPTTSPLPSPSASPTESPTATPTMPTPPPGLPPGWADETQRVVNGPEADLVVRTGAIDNFGFGWPAHYTPFSGAPTPPHEWVCSSRPGAAPGTDRNELGTGVTQKDLDTRTSDGYSHCDTRPDNLPQAVPLAVGALPANIHQVFFQMFLDDFQPVGFHSRFQVSLNGTRIPSFEQTINQLDETGPIGKLVTLRLLPEYWPILRAGTVNLYIDDPTTGAPDGYAVNFVRILVNPHGFRYAVTISCTVVDAATQKPIVGASVAAAQVTVASDHAGHCALRGVPAGLVSVGASAVGYDSQTQLLDLPAGTHGVANFALRRHTETSADLKREIQKNGTVAIYGIHFNTASAKLRPDSLASLEEVLRLIRSSPGAHWIIAGHTDNRGGAAYNLALSDARAHSVVTWLTQHGVAAGSLTAKGYGLTRPIADNATAAGRALNRRVEVSLVK